MNQSPIPKNTNKQSDKNRRKLPSAVEVAISAEYRAKFKRDGVDHIRLSVYGVTVIGKFLDLEFKRVFTIPGIGTFISARAFADWLCSNGNDIYRTNPSNPRTRKLNPMYHHASLYAKYYQLANYASAIKHDEERLADLALVEYDVIKDTHLKVFKLKGLHTVDTLRAMAEHVLTKPEVEYDFAGTDTYSFLDKILDTISEITSPVVNKDQPKAAKVDTTETMNILNTSKPTIPAFAKRASAAAGRGLEETADVDYSVTYPTETANLEDVIASAEADCSEQTAETETNNGSGGFEPNNDSAMLEHQTRAEANQQV